MGRPKAPLTDRDFETLGELIGSYDSYVKRWYKDYEKAPSHIGMAPIDFGGTNGSHHSLTASKLVRHGMAEHRKRGREWGEASSRYRGSKLYRPTDEGRAAYAEWRAKERETVSSPNSG